MGIRFHLAHMDEDVLLCDMYGRVGYAGWQVLRELDREEAAQRLLHFHHHHPLCLCWSVKSVEENPTVSQIIHRESASLRLILRSANLGSNVSKLSGRKSTRSACGLWAVASSPEGER